MKNTSKPTKRTVKRNLVKSSTTNSSQDITIQSNSKPLAPLSRMKPATLEKIEHAVCHLFAGYNIREVTMIEIAQNANVSLQTLYKYFGDKDTVLNTIMDRILGRLAKRMIDHLQGIDSIKDRIRKTLWVCFDFVDTHPEAIMVLNAMSVSGIQNIAIYEDRNLISAFMTNLSEGQDEGILNNKVPLYTLFDVFMGFLNRIGMMHISRGTQTPINDNFDALFDILWRAITLPEGAQG